MTVFMMYQKHPCRADTRLLSREAVCLANNQLPHSSEAEDTSTREWRALSGEPANVEGIC